MLVSRKGVKMPRNSGGVEQTEMGAGKEIIEFKDKRARKKMSERE